MHRKRSNRISTLLVTLFAITVTLAGNSSRADISANDAWQLIDNFEDKKQFSRWEKRDAGNETDPYQPNPQVTERRKAANGNYFLIKKPAPEGVLGNRKALSFLPLPQAIAVGETYTLFTRINVEYFPNNHVFGLSSYLPEDIVKLDYDALEPSLRVTDKTESDGSKNKGALMVKTDTGYAAVVNPVTQQDAQPLQQNIWYDIWYVVNNARKIAGGQRYDVYLRGGEFTEQTKVYSGASFRIQREQPLLYFLTNCNTGPKEQPYGNGGLRYDDIYMARGLRLSHPI